MKKTSNLIPVKWCINQNAKFDRIGIHYNNTNILY